MSTDPFPSSPGDPRFVATVAGVVATGLLYGYALVGSSGLTPREVTFVLLAVTGPATVAYELARRLGTTR